MRRLPKIVLGGFAIVSFLVAVMYLYGRLMFWLAADQALVASCAEADGDASAFEITGTFSNEFYPPSNPAAWCPTGDFGGHSVGAGTGTIGEFSYTANWCIENGVLRGDDEVIATNEGEILIREVTRAIGDPGRFEALLRTRSGPPLAVEGIFAITGGTGVYDGAVGEANVVARQLGGGRTAMAACGSISF